MDYRKLKYGMRRRNGWDRNGVDRVDQVDEVDDVDRVDKVDEKTNEKAQYLKLLLMPRLCFWRLSAACSAPYLAKKK
jgi:hypothetical protein